jgi:cysteine-rich repeat protein
MVGAVRGWSFALFFVGLGLSGCPSSLQSLPNALCQADDDCEVSQICTLAEGAAYGVCVSACGNGRVDSGEQCDDGNLVESDGCTNACIACGNGQLTPGLEECDDGNREEGDACTNTCVLARCGDGVQRRDIAEGAVGFEACDDGNGVATDTCTNSCTLARCGDAIAREDITDPQHPDYEECDDGREGDNSDQDDCRDFCRNWFCGDGVRNQRREQCDDGNDSDLDNCHNDCTLAYCGDGIVRTDLSREVGTWEGCDDANMDQTDDCPNNCKPARCGDGHLRVDLQPGADGYEACDDGVDNSDVAACTLECMIARCGDGHVRADLSEGEAGYEECDDGNTESGDNCSASCLNETPDFRTQFRSSDGQDLSIVCTESCQICRPEPDQSNCIEVVPFAGGTFTMGTDGEVAGTVHHFPAHEVTIGSFYIAKTETTRGAWLACRQQRQVLCDDNRRGLEGPTRPVGASAVEAQLFCEWFGGRLPTDAEWEFAARGGGGRAPYPWGAEEPNCFRVQSNDHCVGDNNSTAEVCRHAQRATPEGLCDMAGNIAELTYDQIGTQTIPVEIPAGNQQPIVNPVYREANSITVITRGGNVRSDDEDYQVFARSSLNKNGISDAYGFRCIFSATTLAEMTVR